MFDFKWKNDGSIKLLIIVGTRPEIIRLAATIKRCREYFDCCVAHTGQNYDYELNEIMIRISTIFFGLILIWVDRMYG